MRYLWVIVFAVILSCNGQKKAAMEKGEGSNNAIASPTLVLQDNYSGGLAADTLIIKDRKSLQKFFSKVNRTRKPGLPLPVVDFTKEMILIYCSGEQPLGNQVSLSLVEENDQELILKTTTVATTKEKSA
ncbi:MAG: hypothetical protein WBM98_00835, partial [Maribacter sp.]|uniref:hypothetical protein n=1 Tax=Maribacter sp. TaxID=1897614 RepID=UPI003C78C7B5